MKSDEIEKRFDAIEAELAKVREQLPKDRATGWEQFVGAFRGDPAFAKAMKFGRQYRESLRPRKRRSPKKKP